MNLSLRLTKITLRLTKITLRVMLEIAKLYCLPFYNLTIYYIQAIGGFNHTVSL